MTRTFHAEATFQLTPYQTGRFIGWNLALEWPISVISGLLAIPVPADADLYALGFVDGLLMAWEASGGNSDHLGNGYGI